MNGARPFLFALAIGLLIGIERERAKDDSPAEDPLGSRTFTLLALLGAVAAYMENFGHRRRGPGRLRRRG